MCVTGYGVGVAAWAAAVHPYLLGVVPGGQGSHGPSLQRPCRQSPFEGCSCFRGAVLQGVFAQAAGTSVPGRGTFACGVVTSGGFPDPGSWPLSGSWGLSGSWILSGGEIFASWSGILLSFVLPDSRSRSRSG